MQVITQLKPPLMTTVCGKLGWCQTDCQEVGSCNIRGGPNEIYITFASAMGAQCGFET